ncbi:hypothetical protein D7D52_36110 [Nocardia yunnanensis]|uniref:Uncharacterized protein n=1 Tax=Nocardia yunnanensis TaxID=2382165 RepID=A0A386ZLA9_9NOCA|nr:hypothetical protein D7D52_36110 [Nocardia yunnanensis]
MWRALYARRNGESGAGTLPAFVGSAMSRAVNSSWIQDQIRARTSIEPESIPIPAQQYSLIISAYTGSTA